MNYIVKDKDNIFDKKICNRIWIRLLICLLGSVLLGFVMNQYKLSTPLYTGLLSLLFITLLIVYYFAVNKYKRREAFLRLILINTILFFLLYIVFYEFTLLFYDYSIVLQLVIVGICFSSVLFNFVSIISLYKKKELNGEEIIYLVGFMTFLFRAMYTLFNPISCDSRQHDTIAFTNGGGHLGYIWHIWAYGKVPDVDPRNLWEFYQPPLYYVICGYLVKFYTFFKVPIIEAAENIQLFSLFCVTGTGIVADEIVSKITKSNRNRLFLSLILSLCPLFTYLSGSVNNDSLLLFLSILSLYFILTWNEDPTLKNIILAAFAVGLTVMSKNSGALIASGIIVLFIAQVVRNKKKSIWIQYILFGLISLPIGLWWNVRNVIKFDMPFLYFNPASKESIQYIPNYSILERFFDVHNQLNHLYVEIFNTSDNVDHNIIITTFKTILFTCSAEVTLSIITRILGICIFIISVLLSFFIIYCFIKSVINSNVKFEIKISFIAVIISYLIFYLRFIFKEPFVHTMHARYIMPAMVITFITAFLPKINCNERESFARYKNTIIWTKAFIILIYVIFVVAYFALITLMTYK